MTFYEKENVHNFGRHHIREFLLFIYVQLCLATGGMLPISIRRNPRYVCCFLLL